MVTIPVAEIKDLATRVEDWAKRIRPEADSFLRELEALMEDSEHWPLGVGGVSLGSLGMLWEAAESIGELASGQEKPCAK